MLYNYCKLVNEESIFWFRNFEKYIIKKLKIVIIDDKQQMIQKNTRKCCGICNINNMYNFILSFEIVAIENRQQII